MCWPHWRGLPRALKDAIFETFANGPRDAYRANVEQAVALVDQREGRTPQQGTEEQPWCDPVSETPMEGPQ